METICRNHGCLELRVAKDETEAGKLANASMTNEEVLTPEQAVRNLLHDVTANEPFIITHGAYRDVLEARHGALLAAYERGANT